MDKLLFTEEDQRYYVEVRNCSRIIFLNYSLIFIFFRQSSVVPIIGLFFPLNLFEPLKFGYSQLLPPFLTPFV